MNTKPHLLVNSLSAMVVGFSFCLAGAMPATAQNLLTAGDFETSIDPASEQIPGWDLDEFITGAPENINSAQQQNFANQAGEIPGEFGLWLLPFNGGDEGTNFAGINAILSQTVPATPGETYSFVGNSSFQQNYSGGVDFIDGLSPIGMQNGNTAQPSPTQSFFELEFLDGSGSVIQTTSLDLYNDDFQFSGGGWLEHTPVTGIAPVGAVEVRVSAKALNMVENIDPSQSAFYDNFSLTTASAPGTDLLENGNLNTAPEAPPTPEEVLSEFYEFIETPDTSNSITVQGFANDPATGGASGIWIRPFVADSVSAEVKQIVDGMAGTEYEFTASARWEVNYLGDDGSGANETLMQIAFLDDMGEIIESVVLDLRDDGANSQIADNAWYTHTLRGVAPEGTVEVAVSGIVNMLTNNTVNGGTQSGFWDDFSLIALNAGGLEGDFNNDGVVDAIDYALWRENLGGDESVLNGNGDGANGVDTGDFNLWIANFGASAPGVVSTPEPAVISMLMLLAIGAGVTRRRG